MDKWSKSYRLYRIERMEVTVNVHAFTGRRTQPEFRLRPKLKDEVDQEA